MSTTRMSSESDPDEFYDAQELTPHRINPEVVGRSNDDNSTSVEEVFTTPAPQKADSTFDAIEEEERRLLEAKRLADERRRKEDEAMQKRLADLDKRRLQEKEKQEAARRAQENETRRRKLDEMRMLMEEDSTPNRAPPKPPRNIDNLAYTGDDSPFSAEDSSLDIQVPACDAHFQDNEIDFPKHRNVAVVAQRSLSQNSADLFVDAESDASELCKGDKKSLNNINTPIVVKELILQKSIPILEGTKNVIVEDDSPKSGNFSSSSTMESVNVNVLFDQEPDIIQSVKSSSLPRSSDPASQPAQPVAPPRKKKKNKAPLPPGQSEYDESDPMSYEAEGACGFAPELETPTSTVYNLTKDLERSLSMPDGDELGREKLDLSSATRGHRLVTATEDMSAKGDTLERMKGPVIGLGAQGQSDAETESENRKNKTKEERKEVPLGPEMGETLRLTISNVASHENFLIPGIKDANSAPVHMQRPRSNSGSRYLTDKEILEQVMVLNLDTGERLPLSQAEDKLPRCINPLSLHIMRRTKEYSSDSSLHKYMQDQSDDESLKDGVTGREPKTLRIVKGKKRGKKLKKFIGKTVSKIKSNFHHGGEENSSDDDDIADGRREIKVKAAHSHKGPYDFDLLVPVQDMKGDQEGAVWTMKFSHCGRLLATGGQDNLMRVWVLKQSYSYFDDMRQKYSEATKVSPAPSQESINSQAENMSETSSVHEPMDEEDDHSPFMKKPFCIYRGHSADLLDISWSKNYFILSSSMDKTVRLWHVSRKECLCCFQHIDFVTAIAFHPKDDRYFLSGSLDGKLRLWNIPDKKVALWNEVSGHSKLITAANFCLNGRFAVVGTYDGRCVFYSTDQLKYYTQIHVRSTRGKNARGRKITGVEPYPGDDKILVTSNDSRIRMYDLRDLTLTCKYKGCANNSSQIKASFSHDGRYIICGSEDRFVYIWKTQHEFYQIFSSARRDRNDYWEGIRAHTATVTVSIFAPSPHLIIKPQFQVVDPDDAEMSGVRGEVLISADYTGLIKVFINKFKPGSG